MKQLFITAIISLSLNILWETKVRITMQNKPCEVTDGKLGVIPFSTDAGMEKLFTSQNKLLFNSSINKSENKKNNSSPWGKCKSRPY